MLNENHNFQLFIDFYCLKCHIRYCTRNTLWGNTLLHEKLPLTLRYSLELRNVLEQTGKAEEKKGL